MVLLWRQIEKDSRVLWWAWLGVSLAGFLQSGLFVWLYARYRHSPLWEIAWGRARNYTGYALFNLGFALQLQLLRGFWLRALEGAARWVSVPSHRFARRLIFVAGVFVVFSYHTKLRTGFWLEGIGGWTFAAMDGNYLPVPPEASPLQLSSVEKEALIASLAPTVSGHGVVHGRSMLLHFRNGQILPANPGIYGLVFGDYVFGDNLAPTRNTAALFKIVQFALDRQRRGRRFLLPEAVAYPAHTPFQKIDYTGYPPGSSLSEISYWDLQVRVESRETEILAATQIAGVTGG